MNLDYHINGTHYLIKKDKKDELDYLTNWIYINLLINDSKTDIYKISLIVKEIIYDIKLIENENLKKRIMRYVPSSFLKYKKYNKLYPNIL